MAATQQPAAHIKAAVDDHARIAATADLGFTAERGVQVESARSGYSESSGSCGSSLMGTRCGSLMISRAHAFHLSSASSLFGFRSASAPSLPRHRFTEPLFVGARAAARRAVAQERLRAPLEDDAGEIRPL